MRRTLGGEALWGSAFRAGTDDVQTAARVSIHAAAAGGAATAALSATAGSLDWSDGALQHSVAAASPLLAQQAWSSAAAFRGIGHGHTASAAAASDAA